MSEDKTTSLGPPWWASEETHTKHSAWVAETQRQLRLLADKMDAQRMSAKSDTNPLPERPIGDHIGRTDKDFAIEFGGYLANEAERFMQHYNEKSYATSAEADEGVDRWNALKSAIGEFRKRAERARA